MSFIVILKRSIVIKEKVDLAGQMKSFNDEKQFGKTLQLFDKHRNNNIELFSPFMIIQIWKACANLQDIQRRSKIHDLLSMRLKCDPYIQVSLIYLYSINENDSLPLMFLFM